MHYLVSVHIIRQYLGVIECQVAIPLEATCYSKKPAMQNRELSVFKSDISLKNGRLVITISAYYSTDYTPDDENICQYYCSNIINFYGCTNTRD